MKAKAMQHTIKIMPEKKKVALIAHDNKKQDLLDWIRYNRGVLTGHELLATGTTGGLIEKEFEVPVKKYETGPLGGDQQIGSEIVTGGIDLLVFFWDPLEPQPHDPDVKALLRLAVVWNIPIACNRATADFMISSPLMSRVYPRIIMDFESYKHRLRPKDPQASVE
jgi:methylglyoxal synthase